MYMHMLKITEILDFREIHPGQNCPTLDKAPHLTSAVDLCIPPTSPLSLWNVGWFVVAQKVPL